mgnify:CR=1 FL=1
MLTSISNATVDGSVIASANKILINAIELVIAYHDKQFTGKTLSGSSWDQHMMRPTATFLNIKMQFN